MDRPTSTKSCVSHSHGREAENARFSLMTLTRTAKRLTAQAPGEITQTEDRELVSGPCATISGLKCSAPYVGFEIGDHPPEYVSRRRRRGLWAAGHIPGLCPSMVE